MKVKIIGRMPVISEDGDTLEKSLTIVFDGGEEQECTIITYGNPDRKKTHLIQNGAVSIDAVPGSYGIQYGSEVVRFVIAKNNGVVRVRRAYATPYETLTTMTNLVLQMSAVIDNLKEEIKNISGFATE